jgi:flagellar biosynthetic protein FliS
MVQLFETALQHMRKAASALDRNDFLAARPSLDRASDIVSMLNNTLRRDLAPELTKNISRVYVFVLLRLTQAYGSRKALKVREAERAFAPIANAFAQAVVKAASESR